MAESAGSELLVPPPTRGHRSVARVARAWYPVCETEELGERPIARTLLGIPLVVFRDGAGSAGALLDRCPHRNVPLSGGRIVSGQLECPYHGWRFDGAGSCKHVPSLAGDPEGKARNAPSHATREQDGLVWVWATPGESPAEEPFRIPHLGSPGYTVVRRIVDVKATLHATAENALDVPHTAFLHKGLFRAESRNLAITAVVRRHADRVEAEYLGEPRPPGLAARLLSPSGGVVEHVDRFLLPSIAQVEYRLGTENHFVVTTVMSPISDLATRQFVVVAFRLRLPGWLLAPVLDPIAMRIFRQDAEMLARQSEIIERFGGEQFASTEIDVLGPHIWRLLKQAERGEPGVRDVVEERVTLVV